MASDSLPASHHRALNDKSESALLRGTPTIRKGKEKVIITCTGDTNAGGWCGAPSFLPPHPPFCAKGSLLNPFDHRMQRVEMVVK